MGSRNRGYAASGSDWDTMRYEYENSTYESQIPDDESEGVMLDQCRLYITNIPKGLNNDGLRMAFSKYGTLTEVFVNGDPKKCYGLVSYETPGEAKVAMMKLNRSEPLRLNVSIAHKNNNKKKTQDVSRRSNGTRDRSYRERDVDSEMQDDVSTSSRRGDNRSDMTQGDIMSAMKDLPDGELDEDVKQTLNHLRKLLIKQHQSSTKSQDRAPPSSGQGNRSFMPGGKIVVRNDRSYDGEKNRDENSFGGATGDSNERESCACKHQDNWQNSSDGTSTPSTCVLCSDERSKPSDVVSKQEHTKDTDKCARHNKSDTLSNKPDVARHFDVTIDVKYDLLDCSDVDETDRLIELRAGDYFDIVEGCLKVVIALAGYPKVKMRLRHMEHFRKSVSDVMEMQLKANLLGKMPVFIDYYLSKGAIVCICKDVATRDWLIRITPGLQERMEHNLLLLKTKVKRLCFGSLKISETGWPATAQDVFKLLQYFNPALKIDYWKIYSQKRIDNVEQTSFLIDRVSAEIIRGMSFKNVIDYHQIEFELSKYTEIYYECFLSESDEDTRSIHSRVKLLNELRSGDNTPNSISSVNLYKNKMAVDVIDTKEDENITEVKSDSKILTLKDINQNESAGDGRRSPDFKHEFKSDLKENVAKKLKNNQNPKEFENSWSGDVEMQGNEENEPVNADNKGSDISLNESHNASTSAVTGSYKFDSFVENTCVDNKNCINIDSSRGIAYHRRTNYLYVENELKIAVVLEGYPQNKLEGVHMRRLKYLFKEYLHKDMKRFNNLIIPKFQDIYLSNGAVIYICDSLETKDYLAEVLPKFINSTGLKLVFRDINDLVRYTRLVMRLPKEFAHVESLEILLKLQSEYPDLKPDCWKFYSDVAGKQKRQFGVDPASLAVIKSPDFIPTFQGEKITFRIIDRQKKDLRYDEYQNGQDYEMVKQGDDLKKVRDEISELMYVPIEPHITNAPLTRIRTDHYSNLVADDLKLYVGPANYPESRIDEGQFYSIKTSLENIVCENVQSGRNSEEKIPKFHDMYLFDGVIFIICKDFNARAWIEQVLPVISLTLQINLKSTEFRGAVGIISMNVSTDKTTEEVIAKLQKNNPRIRTKYWRKISVLKSENKLDAVLQIDKLSAQVILSPSFNKVVWDKEVVFQLGHLKSLIKPKFNIDELTSQFTQKIHSVQEKPAARPLTKFTMHVPNSKSYQEVSDILKKEYPSLKTESWHVLTEREKANRKLIDLEIDDESVSVIKKKDYKLNVPTGTISFFLDNDAAELESLSDKQGTSSIKPSINSQKCKFTIKIPNRILPENKEDLNALFDVLEDKNPGLNTELWQVTINSDYYTSKGIFNIIVDKKSASIIQSDSFNSKISGEDIVFHLETNSLD